MSRAPLPSFSAQSIAQANADDREPALPSIANLQHALGRHWPRVFRPYGPVLLIPANAGSEIKAVGRTQVDLVRPGETVAGRFASD